MKKQVVRLIALLILTSATISGCSIEYREHHRHHNDNDRGHRDHDDHDRNR